MSAGSSRPRTLDIGVQHVFEYVKRMQAEDPAFFYSLQGDSDTFKGNVFWADGTSRANYKYFGDTVRLETYYRNNHYRVPFVSFTGLNHHAQPVLFGCALLHTQSDASLVWLLQTWLQAMSSGTPVSITSDPDRMIQAAVAQVLPNTRHRFCKWSIFRETQEKLSHIFHSHPTLEIEFKKCINETETADNFETQWQSLLDRYYLMDNEWLQSIHNARHQWVPVYMRDVFFGELSNAEESDAKNQFFDGFILTSTPTQLLIKQYEKAVANWHEKELKADFDTTNITPVLKTPSPMEKQAASLYTRMIFMKFQDELVETLANPATKVEDSGSLATYNVAKFGEEHKAHTVRFNAFEMKAKCSCQMFEFSGIICRHVLSVFRAKNVLTLPAQYVLKRWTRDAKSGAEGTIDVHPPGSVDNSQQSLTVRYNNLRQEALKFVEEGAKSIHVYHVAMNALQDASKKVASARKKQIERTPGSNLANGDNRATNAGDNNQAASHESTEDKEKKIRELTAELDCINQRCEVYRSNLLAILKDMEDEKLKLSVKVQNARLSLKE